MGAKSLGVVTPYVLNATPGSQVAPNSLIVSNPYSGVSGAIVPHVTGTPWRNSGQKMMIANNTSSTRLPLQFVPSVLAATYTIAMWSYNATAGVWVLPANYGSISYTGIQSDFIDQPGDDPIYLQLVSISSGTLSIYHNAAVSDAQ